MNRRYIPAKQKLLLADVTVPEWARSDYQMRQWTRFFDALSKRKVFTYAYAVSVARRIFPEHGWASTPVRMAMSSGHLEIIFKRKSRFKDALAEARLQVLIALEPRETEPLWQRALRARRLTR